MRTSATREQRQRSVDDTDDGSMILLFLLIHARYFFSLGSLYSKPPIMGEYIRGGMSGYAHYLLLLLRLAHSLLMVLLLLLLMHARYVFSLDIFGISIFVFCGSILYSLRCIISWIAKLDGMAMRTSATREQRQRERRHRMDALSGDVAIVVVTNSCKDSYRCQ